MLGNFQYQTVLLFDDYNNAVSVCTCSGCGIVWFFFSVLGID